MTTVTNKDVIKNLWGTKVTIPKGTKVRPVQGALHGTTLYAVDSVALLIELTGNTHDPKYRYAFISHKNVENI